jgi:hypothetical protein
MTTPLVAVFIRVISFALYAAVQTLVAGKDKDGVEK